MIIIIKTPGLNNSIKFAYYVQGDQMKHLVTTILSLLLAIIAHGQTSAIVVWEDRVDSWGSTEFQSVIKTIDGGFIAAGNNGQDGLIVKYDTSNTVEWTNIYWTMNNDYHWIHSIVQHSDGGYVFVGTVIFDADEDLWLVKINNLGEVVWDYRRLEENDQEGIDLVETVDGNILIVGSGYSTETESLIFSAIMVDQDGNELWSQSYSEANHRFTTGVVRAEDNGFAISGFSYSTGTDSDFFLTKIDESGVVEWEEVFEGETGRERAYSMCNTFDGGYLLVGDAGNSWENVQVVKFEENGDIAWSNSIPFSPGNYARSVSNAMDGGFLIGGQNPGVSSSRNHWILKIDSTGNYIWDQTFDTQDYDHGFSVESIDANNFLIAGSSDDDGYIARVSPVIPTGNIVINEIMINPDQVGDSDGEWFEVVNTSGTIVNLHRWQILSNTENHLIGNEIFLYPDEYTILSTNSDFANNGGVNVLYEYSGISFNNYEDEISLIDSSSLLIDSVSWNGSNGFPLEIGITSALLDLQVDNVEGANWFLSNLPFGDGDLGTPNHPNHISIISVIQPINELPVTMIGASNDVSITISNSGNDTLRFGGSLSSNPEFELVLFDSLIVPFEVSQAELHFTPVEHGERTSTITIINSAYSNESFQFDVSGISIPANPDITCSPDTLIFEISEPPNQEIIISNNGTLDLSINDIEVSSYPTDYDFSIHSGIVHAGGSISFEVSYLGPIFPIPEQNSLVVYSNDPDEAAYTIQILFLDGTSIEDETIPIMYSLKQNYPNPFNPITTIKYGLPEDATVSLIVYDIRGNVVRTIDPGTQVAGWHEKSWYGLDYSGHQVSTGIYLARLQAGSYSKTIKMLYLK